MNLRNAEEVPMIACRRDDLIEDITDGLSNAIRERDHEAYGRAHQELPPQDIAACLGDGRCMFLKAQRKGIYCPFCLHVPPRVTLADVPEVVRRFVKGH